MSLRLAAYALCIQGDMVLLARHVPQTGEDVWTLPGGGVEQGEDPFDAVTRELKEETGCDGTVECLLGVDSRLIPGSESHSGFQHQNVGIFYSVQITGGQLRPEPNGSIAESAWMQTSEIGNLRRSSLVDVGLALALATPATGHGAPVPIGGLIQH